MAFKQILKTVGHWIGKNSTKLLAAGAITSELLGFYFMHKEAPIVRDRIKALPEGATWKDKVKVATPVYLPAIAMGIISSGCIIGGCAAGEYKAALLSGLCSTSQTFVEKYERQLAEKVGPEVLTEAKTKAAAETMKPQIADENTIIYTGYGDDIFKEPFTERFFTSNIEAVNNGVAEYNRDLTGSISESVNCLLDKWGVPAAELGKYFCYNADDLYDRAGKKGLDISFEPGFAPNGRPCLNIIVHDSPKLWNGSRPKEC